MPSIVSTKVIASVITCTRPPPHTRGEWLS
jgi:hypothetical protein